MQEPLFKGYFILCLAIYLFGLFGPHYRKIKSEKVRDSRIGLLETLFLVLAFLGMQVVPVLYILTPWLDFADLRLPFTASVAAGMLGAITFAASLLVMWKAHRDLGRSWSPTLQVKEDHRLVTQGIYRYVRHPIYAAQWLWGLAQLLLLQNWIAGLAGLVSFLPVYIYRVPREEQMMLDHFGEEYKAYMERTGGIMPRQIKRNGRK